jgi:hypothetical protein
MEREFVPYEQASSLIALGFNEPVIAHRENGLNICLLKQPEVLLTDLSMILFQQAFRWFREKYGLFVAPNAISYENGPYLWFFEVNSTILSFGIDLGETDDFETYEEAELACLIKLIEIVKLRSE